MADIEFRDGPLGGEVADHVTIVLDGSAIAREIRWLAFGRYQLDTSKVLPTYRWTERGVVEH